MPQDPTTARTETARPAAAPPSSSWEPPRYRVIPLDCEITAYAPDDEPLF